MRITEGIDGVRLAVGFLHPDGRAPRDERSAPPRDVRRPMGGVRRRTRRRVPVAGCHLGGRDRRRRIPDNGSLRSVTAESSMSRSQLRWVSIVISGSSPTTRRCRAWSRPGPACVRWRRSTSAATSTGEGSRHERDRRARRTASPSSRSIGPSAAMRSTARPRLSLPTRSARSTADDAHDVAVLTGANGTFCAGADLKAIGDERRESRSGARATVRWDRLAWRSANP